MGVGVILPANKSDQAYCDGPIELDTFCDTSPISTTVELQGRVAMIQTDGSCSYTEKVNNAADLGAFGVIVFRDPAGGDTWITMTGSPVPMPAGFITYQAGIDLQTAHGELVVISAENQRKALIP